MTQLTIGIVGPIASGKGEAIKILGRHGFSTLSLSDIIRAELKQLGKEITRTNLQDHGNYLRQTYGAHILAQRAHAQLTGVPRVAIESIRNPAEVIYLKANLKAIIIAITAPIELRTQWLLDRHRREDPVNIASIKQSLQRDLGVGESSTGQQVIATQHLADYTIINDGSLLKLTKTLNSLLQSII
jgi:dephospho-CoA kinase